MNFVIAFNRFKHTADCGQSACFAASGDFQPFSWPPFDDSGMVRCVARIPFEETWKPWPVCIFTWFIVTYPRGWDPRLISLNLSHFCNIFWRGIHVENGLVIWMLNLCNNYTHLRKWPPPHHPHPRLIREMETVEDWKHRTTGTTETLSPFPSCRACSPCTLKKQTPGCSLRSSSRERS